MIWFRRRKGFTLLELMIVVIIIGILASLAIPRFIEATKKAKKAEGYSLLATIRSAQMRYYLENNNKYYNSGANIDKLDITLTTSKYYDYVGADAATSPTYIGAAESKDTAIVPNLGIKEDGTVDEGITKY